MYPLSAYLFKLARCWLQRLSHARLHSWRVADALNLTASRRRLGLGCRCRTSCPRVAAVTPQISRSRAFARRAAQLGRSAVAIIFDFVSRLADGDDNVVRWLRASALRPQGSSSNVRLVLEHVFKHLISWIN